MKKSVFLIALALCCAATARAEKKPVRIDCTAGPDDWIGKRLCTALHDDIAKSPRYREVEGDEFMKMLTNHAALAWWIHLASTGIDNGGGIDNAQSAQAFIVTASTTSNIPPFYIGGQLLTTGASKVEQQAENIIAMFDEEVQNNP